MWQKQYSSSNDSADATDPQLDELRELIDATDQALLDVLTQRAQLVDQVAELKRAKGLPIVMPARERAIIESVRNRAEAAGLSADMVEDIFRCVLAESHRRMRGD
ncbi:MAG TPA: chorismate mutase [Gammaproteobacteria bacterium]|nr:chorismate mutase [Gammaproteobacteria bacterium]